MDHDVIKCGHCKGTGWRKITRVYLRTLELLRKENKPISGVALSRKYKCGAEAMCNRLATLSRQGFVLSFRKSRTRLYIAKENFAGDFTPLEFGNGAAYCPF